MEQTELTSLYEKEGIIFLIFLQILKEIGTWFKNEESWIDEVSKFNKKSTKIKNLLFSKLCPKYEQVIPLYHREKNPFVLWMYSQKIITCYIPFQIINNVLKFNEFYYSIDFSVSGLTCNNWYY